MPRKKKTKPTREHITHCIKILDWETSYSLHMDTDRRIHFGPYWEHVELKVYGTFIHPIKLADKSVEILFLGDRDKTMVLNSPEKFQDYTPKCIGSLTVRGEKREYLILNGYALRYGSAEILSLHFDMKYDEEDWI